MEQNFSPQESLRLIESMINKTKASLGENKVYFLLWGWVTFIAIISQFILKVVLNYEHHYLVWLITFPTIVVTIIYTAKRSKKRQAKTYIGESMASLWTGIGTTFLILSVLISYSKDGWLNAWPFYILLYGTGTFISGNILKFNPLIIGGILNWVLAITSIFVPFDYQLLLAAAAILTSYIIPGYLLGTNKN